jgi:hypothetical protein
MSTRRPESFKFHDGQSPGMTEVVPPDERTCERCGREDAWDESAGKWVVVTVDGESRHGTPHCLHEWDINGTYKPLKQ